MKKKLLTIAVLMTMAFAASAQSDSFFKWNDNDNDLYRTNEEFGFSLPQSHGVDYDSEAPLGSGLLVFTALGAGYAAACRKRVSRQQN